MPVLIPGSKVWSDIKKVKFLTIFDRPKTGFFDQISGVPGPFPQFPLATNHAALAILSVSVLSSAEISATVRLLVILPGPCWDAAGAPGPPMPAVALVFERPGR